MPKQHPKRLDGFGGTIVNLPHQGKASIDGAEEAGGEAIPITEKAQGLTVGDEMASKLNRKVDDLRRPGPIAGWRLKVGQAGGCHGVEERILVLEAQIDGHRIDPERSSKFAHAETVEAGLRNEFTADGDDLVLIEVKGRHDLKYTPYIDRMGDEGPRSSGAGMRPQVTQAPAPLSWSAATVPTGAMIKG